MNQRPLHRRAALVVIASVTASILLVSAPSAFAADAPVKTLPGPMTPPPISSVIETKVTREQAIAVAYQLFSIPKELGDPNVSKNQSKDMATWNLSWQSDPKKADHLSINVNIDAVTGAVLGYNRSFVAGDPNTAPPAYTRSEAESFARQWMAKLTVGNTAVYQLQEQSNSYGYYGPVDASYNFVWQRMEQGYPVNGDSLTIAIDARTGELQSFNHYWQRNLTFKLPDTQLSQVKAESIFKNQVAMGLFYQYFQQPGLDKGVWKLVYRSQMNGYPPISQSGDPLDYTGSPITQSSNPANTPVPAPDKPYVAPKALLSEADALSLAQAASGETTAPTNTSYNEYGKDDTRTQAWQFSWVTKGDGPNEGSNINVQVDAAKGVVTNFNNWSYGAQPQQDVELKITQDEARQTAMDFIRNIRPDLAGKLVMLPGDPQEAQRIIHYGNPGFNVNFGILQNNVVVADRGGSVEVDAITGKVRSFYMNNQPGGNDEFPAVPDNLLKPADATDAYLNAEGFNLQWNIFNPMVDKLSIMAGEEPKSFPMLVWAPGNALSIAAIDAVTGAPLDWQGRDLVELAKHPTDIAGNFAEREIELLWSRQIFDLKDGKFRPDDVATASDLARWLVLAKGMQPYPMYDFAVGMGAGMKAVATSLAAAPAAPYFGAALQSGIILPEDFDPDTDPTGPVSREQFALWVVRAMGYGAIAKMPNHIEMSFTDKAQIGDRYANAMAILNGLGIMKGDGDGNANPQRSITRAEAAKLIFAVASQVRR